MDIGACVDQATEDARTCEFQRQGDNVVSRYRLRNFTLSFSIPPNTATIQRQKHGILNIAALVEEVVNDGLLFGVERVARLVCPTEHTSVHSAHQGGSAECAHHCRYICGLAPALPYQEADDFELATGTCFVQCSQVNGAGIESRVCKLDGNVLCQQKLQNADATAS